MNRRSFLAGGGAALLASRSFGQGSKVFMETLGNPFQFAGRAALEQMKLKAPV